MDLNTTSLENVTMPAMFLFIESLDIHSATKRIDLYCVNVTFTVIPAAVVPSTPVNKVTLTETLSAEGEVILPSFMRFPL